MNTHPDMHLNLAGAVLADITPNPLTVLRVTTNAAGYSAWAVCPTETAFMSMLNSLSFGVGHRMDIDAALKALADYAEQTEVPLPDVQHEHAGSTIGAAVVGATCRRARPGRPEQARRPATGDRGRAVPGARHLAVFHTHRRHDR